MPVLRPTSSRYTASFSPTAFSEAEESDIWFDASSHLDMDEKGFDCDVTNSVFPPQKIEERIPFSEDCRRCLLQLISYLGKIKQHELISTGIARLVPGAPLELIMAADSLYTAVTQGENSDIALLNVLGLTACQLPADKNTIALLARFVRNSVLACIGESFFNLPSAQDEDYPGSTIFTSLAVLAMVARYWITDDTAPQRRLLRIPLFMGNLLLRANLYWNYLGRMAKNAVPTRPALLEHKTFAAIYSRNKTGRAGHFSRPPEVSTYHVQPAGRREQTARSAAAGNERDVILPLVAGAAAVGTRHSAWEPALHSNVLLTAAGSLTATIMIVGGKFIANAFSSGAAAKENTVSSASSLPDSDDVGAVQEKQHSLVPQAAAIWAENVITTAPVLPTDEVKIEKLYDFSCIDSRKDLLWANIIRQVGATLSSPLQALAAESQVIHSHLTLGSGCPSPQDRQRLAELTGKIDAVITQLLTLLPGSQPIAIIQTIVGPAMQMIADDLSGSPRDTTMLGNINSQILFIGRQTIPALNINQRKKIMGGDSMQKHDVKPVIGFHNGMPTIKIKNKSWEIYEDINYSPYVVNQGAKYVYFDLATKEWKYLPAAEKVKYSVENIKKVTKDIVSIPQIKASSITALEKELFQYQRENGKERLSTMMNGQFVAVNSDKIRGETVLFSARSGIAGRVIIHGESGYFFEPQSTALNAHLKRVIQSEFFSFTTGQGKTAINNDGCSYDSFGDKHLKFEEKYYRVHTDENLDYLATTQGAKYYLEKNNGEFTTSKYVLADTEEFRTLNNGQIISKSLFTRLQDEGQVAIPGEVKSHYKSVVVDESNNQFLKVGKRFYRLLHDNRRDGMAYKVKNKESNKDDIAIYRTRDDFFPGRDGEILTADYLKEISCVGKRSPPGGSSSCSSVFISKLASEELKSKYQSGVDERNLVIVDRFPNTFYDTKKRKTYFRYDGMYFKCELQDEYVAKMGVSTLKVLYNDKSGFFHKKVELCRLVYLTDGKNIYINSEEELLLARTTIKKREAQAYLSDNFCTACELNNVVKQMRRNENNIPISFLNDNFQALSETEILSSIKERFFRGKKNWETISLTQIKDSMPFHLRSSARHIQQAAKFAVNVLERTIAELDARSDNVLSYLSVILNTNNIGIVISFSRTLSVKLTKMKNWIKRTDFVLCFTHKQPIEGIPPEADPARDSDWGDFPQVPWETVYAAPNLNEQQRTIGVLAFTLANKDKRIWLTLDSNYLADPTHPDESLRKDSVLRPYMTILHEASHKNGMSRDIIYVPVEGGEKIPILDALDFFSQGLEQMNLNDYESLGEILSEYIKHNHEYTMFDKEQLMNPRMIKFIFENDPHFKAAILYNVADFLAIIARDIYQNSHIRK